ncbi:glycine cleavage system protein GcvH [Thermosediminibacter oceani]|uniref:Glycine cleavage system H protein n=1 Tax=Thermosediminibacter oceani (strain ATCC BAA-1034 / DSM 16646 / JW/IW-1228P) TaxID=555079 RepID=D9S2F0_THEOJ|nr:glycine cleavage system protein GcvH [Thermosediminibacter oceani]ADL07577.1 glycine cleavage system H protein [Thermosediminibacter oceani DSM 16646]
MNLPSGIKYHREHTWAKVEGDYAVIGITDYAQDKLGEVLFVDLPEVGDNIKKDDIFGTVESGKVASDLYAPVSGEVVEVNEELADSPELVNQSPYEKGWMIKVKMSDPSELEELLESVEYSKILK